MSDARFSMVSRRYQEVFGAALTPSFTSWIGSASQRAGAATLGYRRAGAEVLFLEHYLTEPVEVAVSKAFGRDTSRERIVEIGNFAADNAIFMLELWGAAANDLGDASEIAVATLTAPLRRMFTRIGIPIVQIAAARAELLGPKAVEWGSYYNHDPVVCAGVIADGQKAISAFLSRRFLGRRMQRQAASA